MAKKKKKASKRVTKKKSVKRKAAKKKKTTKRKRAKVVISLGGQEIGNQEGDLEDVTFQTHSFDDDFDEDDVRDIGGPGL